MLINILWILGENVAQCFKRNKEKEKRKKRKNDKVKRKIFLNHKIYLYVVIGFEECIPF